MRKPTKIERKREIRARLRKEKEHMEETLNSKELDCVLSTRTSLKRRDEIRKELYYEPKTKAAKRAQVPLSISVTRRQKLLPTSSTYQKHLKLGHCLEIDDRISHSKFGYVTRPSLHFTDRSIFYRLVCKIVNL